MYPRYAPDPVLNRGVALESLRRFEEAAADYEAVLAFNPYDPAAWNNLGNVMVRVGLMFGWCTRHEDLVTVPSLGLLWTACTGFS